MSQYDLPPQTLIQQSSARAVSGEELETYGNHAADLYGSGAQPTLNAAVVETVKSAGLAPEQVRRVVEFANTCAFLSEFNKEGAASKYVVFDGGPAHFGEVIKDLNDGGGGTVFDRGIADYSHTPIKTSAARGFEKTAAAVADDDILAEVFRVGQKAAPIPFAKPLADVYDLRDKLATIKDAHTAQMSELEVDLLSVSEEMYHQVKQAALSGTSLGAIVQAWNQALAPKPELVKAAFAFLSPRLQEEVFSSWDALGASIEKTAGTRLVVNEKHPVVVTFDAYCDTLAKLAQLRASRNEVVDGINQLTTFERLVNQHYSEVV
jgi:hypothetical protein